MLTEKSARIVFAGTPEFAAEHLRALCEAGLLPVAVYTQPDRPAGRGQRLQPSAVKQLAQNYRIPVEQPLSLKDPDAQAVLRDYRPDLLIVVAYGLLLPQAVLDIPRQGCVNVHGSLLPRWRGAAPIQRAIQAGDAETGVDLMKMEAGLDTGPVYAEAKTPIRNDDTAQSVHDRLAQLGSALLVTHLDALLRGELTANTQSSDGVSYARKLEKTEAAIDWQQPAATIDRQIRAFNPFPGAHSGHNGETVKIWIAHVVATDKSAAPGEIMAQTSDALIVACGCDALAITELQLPGGKRMAVCELLKSRRERFACGTQFANL